MTNIGESLMAPEASWRRYDETALGIVYTGTWSTETNASHYGGSMKFTATIGSSAAISFSFYGTKLRFIAPRYTNHPTNTIITIDGSDYTFSQNGSLVYQALQFEKTGLSLGLHTVSIVSTVGGTGTRIDAIDIDDTGYIGAVGQELTAPEFGWKRVQETDSRFVFDSSWIVDTTSSNSGGSSKYVTSGNHWIIFSFYGTKLRYIGNVNLDRLTGNVNNVIIDGVNRGGFSQYSTSAKYSVVNYEILDLALGTHEVIINTSGVIAFDAIDIDLTIGDQLTTPESGWKRYDAQFAFLKTSGLWSSNSPANAYNASLILSNVQNGSLKFLLQSTKLRIICATGSAYTDQVTIKIDGVAETFSTVSASGTAYQTLVYEKLALSDSVHTIEIINNKALAIYLDALDTDINARVYHPDEVTNISDLVVGKRIRCHYQATSGVVGSFSGLGIETSDFIPAASSATPNGDFYWLMVEDVNKKKVLVADRNVQSAIAWDTLNTAGIASGSGVPLTKQLVSIVPKMTSNSTPYGVASASSVYSTDAPAWKAFDKTTANVWLTTSQSWNGSWIRYDSPTPYIVESYVITGGASSMSTDAPQGWRLEGSNNNGSTWKTLDTKTGVTGWSNNQVRSYTISNTEAYSSYRIVITANGGGAYARTSEIDFLRYQTDEELVSGSIRLLTGGVSSADSDNEWDKYIVNSTLNGMITAGDNGVWNWNSGDFYTLTSTASSSSRVVRGKTLAGWTSVGSSNLSNSAFRPVLIIETPTSVRSLFKFDGGYKKWVEGTPEIVNTQNIIPKMASDANGIIALSTNSNNVNGFQSAYYAFDGVSTTAFANGVSQYPCWLQVDMGEMKKVDKYSVLYNFATVGSHMSNWDFQGSINGSEWSMIDSQTISAWNIGETKVFTVNNPLNYRYYRILMKSGTQYSVISELQLITVESTTPETPAHWQTISTTFPSADTFKSNGMSDLSIMDRKSTTFVSAMSDNGATGSVLGSGKVFKKSVDLKKLFEITNIKI